ncbi:MAG TPA: delta-60 repeat domain-containing protein [Steroidobacteraceae bacterium]
MTFSKVEDPDGVGTITFDRFNGTLDLSSIDVGQPFALFLGAIAIAGTGNSPEFPGEAIASYRDPLSFDGGITIETEGLTPLNISAAPVPRDQSHAIVTQGDGKMVSAGSAFDATNNDDFAVARYNADGSLDTTFDGDGKLTTDFAGGSDVALAAALQADGKLLVAGEAGNGNDSDIAVARYNSDGSLDASFGSAGKVRLDLTGADEVAQSIAVQADGKIVVAGYIGNDTGRDFLVVRLNGDGSIDDDAFGTQGFARLDFAGGADYVTALTLQSDGKIVLAGTANLGDAATKTDFALARYNSDGTIDGSFGAAGQATTDLGGSTDFVEALAVQSGDGKLIVAGHTSKDADANFVVARYSKDGTLDADFANGGTLIEDFGGSNDYAYAVTPQSDGKILLAGYTQSASEDFAVLRLNANGAVDTTFGVDGKVAIDFSGGDDFAESMTPQADGKILVAGWAATATGDDFAVARLNP